MRRYAATPVYRGLSAAGCQAAPMAPLPCSRWISASV